LARLRVESGHVEHDDPLLDARSQLDAIAAHLPLWHLAAVLNLAFVLAWFGALTGCVLVIGARRRWAALTTAVVAVVAGVGLAMHNAFYYLTLAELAGASDRARAAAVAADAGSDPLSLLALLMFMVGGLLTPVVLGVALWRAHALPWWAALGLLIWLAAALIGSELMLGALLNLALLLPFAAVARQLRVGRPVARGKFGGPREHPVPPSLRTR
jgi:hypothetical protein